MTKLLRTFLLAYAILLNWPCASFSRSALPDRFSALPPIGGDFVSVFSILRDELGFVWMGTASGLVRYDGYDYKVYSREDGLPDNIVNALVMDGQGRIFVGTDAGACIYDSRTDRITPLSECGSRHVKGILLHGNDIYLATTSGLLVVGNGTARLYDSASAGLPSDHIACVRAIGEDIWLGAYDHLYQFLADGSFVIHPLSPEPRKQLLLDIAPDPGHPGRLWLGTESGLLNYDPATRTKEKYLENIPVKNFLPAAAISSAAAIPDAGPGAASGNSPSAANLWFGTDNGLYIMSPDGQFTDFRHRVGDNSSLPNNVVWCVRSDAQGNIWLGTDHGAALTSVLEGHNYVGVAGMTGSPEGLDIGVISTSEDGTVWLSGRNGLIRYEQATGRGKWYKADSGPADERLSHNKVHSLYDDGEGLWIASDGGLDYLRAGTVRHFRLTEKSRRYNSNWMYCLAEDRLGRLWAGTYDGGLFITDKAGILSSGEETLCDIHLCKPTISSNVVMAFAMTENFVAAAAGGNIDIIDVETLSVSSIPMPDNTYVYTMIAEGEKVWIGSGNGVYLLENGKIERIGEAGLQIASILRHGNYLWFTGGGGKVGSLNLDTGEWTHRHLKDPVLSIASNGNGYIFGTVDGIWEIDYDAITSDTALPGVCLTGLYFDDRPVEPGKEYNSDVILPENISAMEHIVLPHSMNTFSIGFSSFPYGSPELMYMYRLRGLDDTWQRTSHGEHRAVFINVPGGEYVFEVAAASPDGQYLGPATSINVRVRHAWYATGAAYAIYVLLFLGLCAAIFYYIRMRQQLHLEHVERDRAIKMADMKTEFLANVSHEFKSPLSIILSFLGRMISSESDSLRTRELHTIQKNADKIHLLLNQMVEFNENRSLSLFIPTATSLTDIVKGVYDRYAEAFAEKGIASRFVADDIDYIFMVDRVKLESVIQNLLSNALKFTPRGGSVLVSVTATDSGKDMVYADIKVEDTGCGIPEEELPLIFNRYYRSGRSLKDNPSGSGIGLALVKQIVEMHKGTVDVSSEPGKGTVFTVRLSTMKADSFVLKAAEGGESELSLHHLSNVWQHDRKPIILLVEDNADIRDFITASLGNDYVFLTASEGQAGLELIGKEKIDLVITDIAMPGMDGLSMSRTIRNSMDTAFLPIIILTGKNDAETEMKSFEYADAFIAKPFSLNNLNNRIIQLLIKHEQHLAKIRQQKMLEQEVDQEQSYEEKILQEVVEIVSRHLEDPNFSATALCEESKYSSKQIYRKVKQITGMSIVEFIRDTRLRRAALYLAQGKLSVTEVMYKVGFTTASYFSKCFKEKFGVSPSEYSPAE